MRLMLKILSLTTMLALAGCAAEDLRNINNILSGATPGGGTLAQPVQSGGRQSTQLIVPNDKRTEDAMNAALPEIKKVLAIQQCMKDANGFRLLNFHGMPGVDFASKYQYSSKYPMFLMKYHDKNKCLSVKTLDRWQMPALNALKFRSVYFADDSGEMANFELLFKLTDDGSWKLADFEYVFN